MRVLDVALASLRAAVPLLLVLAAVLGGLFLVRYLLERRLGGVPDSRFRIQLVMLALSLAGLLAIILALPVGDELRGQLLSLLGILLSASIALSSTTFLGNALAGVLLRVVGGFRMGDYVRVGEHAGRVSERGLFHTEIQTEDRDLTTLPNMYLVTNPVRVVRSSGTIISTHVSLGYDVSRLRVEEALLAAGEKAGLEEPFVQVEELGDFSVVYRLAGLLTEVKRILSARSRLREAVMDSLHGAGIEIVSPNFMNTRALAADARVVPAAAEAVEEVEAPGEDLPEEVIFDKAEEAETREELEAAREAEAKASPDEIPGPDSDGDVG